MIVLFIINFFIYIQYLLINNITHATTHFTLIFYIKIVQAGQPPVTESQLERVIEELEGRCWERIQTIVKNEEGLGIEYDENVICDVCRSVSD